MTPTAMTVTQPTPSLPLASFYNADGHMVWPGDAPTAGDLKEKRSEFDQASETVLAELKKNGVASIATVTDARQKLLDYGRPGLNMSATHETPRVADAYHLFLLSLYESLAQAVNPKTPAPSTPTTPRLPEKARRLGGRHHLVVEYLPHGRDFASPVPPSSRCDRLGDDGRRGSCGATDLDE